MNGCESDIVQFKEYEYTENLEISGTVKRKVRYLKNHVDKVVNEAALRQRGTK